MFAKRFVKGTLAVVMAAAMVFGTMPLAQFTTEVMADLETVNVSTVDDFGTPSSYWYVLQSKKYVLNSDIEMPTTDNSNSGLKIQTGRTAEIDLKGIL